jgi:zinc-binding alcohol dehydrogenase family protein
MALTITHLEPHMKAIGLTHYLPISDPLSLQEFDLPMPIAAGRDLLVQVAAISVNPVDTKVRKPKDTVEMVPKVLGWDAAGTVTAIGPDVTHFKVGDLVYYAGSILRPGANSEFHLVDERIAGHKPASLHFIQAAALPLTTITAWEAMFDRLRINRDGADAGKSILIIGGAGGVGSIAIQLAKQVAQLRVITTASRPASAKWCRDLGADLVIDHTGDMQAQLLALGVTQADFILCLNDTDMHFPAMSALIAPQGLICCIVDNNAPLNMASLKAKSAGVVWEMMFTRSMFHTADMDEQRKLLNETARLIDAGIIKTTLGEVFGKITAENLRRAHATLEAGRMIGKIVLEGF